MDKQPEPCGHRAFRGGKSFILNHICRQYYEQGAHIVIVDTGNSYQGLCSLIRQKTKGRDGIYFTYQEDAPLPSTPSLSKTGVRCREARIAQGAVADFVEARIRGTDTCGRGGLVECREPIPLATQDRHCGHTFVQHLLRVRRNGLPPSVGKKRVREKDFDIENFLNVLEPYYRGGSTTTS